MGVSCTAAVAVGELLLSLLLVWSWIKLGDDDDEYEEVDEYGEDV